MLSSFFSLLFYYHWFIVYLTMAQILAYHLESRAGDDFTEL